MLWGENQENRSLCLPALLLSDALRGTLHMIDKRVLAECFCLTGTGPEVRVTDVSGKTNRNTSFKTPRNVL